MSAFSRIPIVFRLIFVISCFLFVTSVSRLPALFFHNLGMLQYQWLLNKDGITSRAWQPTATALQKVLSIDSNNTSASMRLAGLFTLLGKYQIAEKYAQYGLSSLGKPKCYIRQHDFWRLVATPRQYIPDQLLDFGHPQSRWKFEKVYLPKGDLFFSTSSDDKRCVAHIVVDHDLISNQFLWLWQEIKVIPNRTYQFSAIVQSIGIDRAWMGVKSQWPGVRIRQQDGWQHIYYEFDTGPTQITETVQFVVDAGHGTLTVDHVILKEVDDENRY